nr:transmembrane protein CCDC163 [Pongo abelii]
MYRSLSWFEQLDVLLNATNGNVVRIKVTEALRQAVQGLLEEREQQKYQISVLEASLRLLQGAPKGSALLLEQRLEELRRELQGLRSQVWEQAQAQAQMQTGQGECSTTNGLPQELQTEISIHVVQLSCL